MRNLLDFFKRGGRGRSSDPIPPDHPAKGPPFNPFDPFGEKTPDRGPCLRCGELADRNSLQFCMPCWVFATDLARWAVDKKVELGLVEYQEGEVVEVPVEQWAFVYTAKFPRDPGPDPADPTYPDTIVPKGSYWQPEGGRPDPNHGKVRGICSCHFYRWN